MSDRLDRIRVYAENLLRKYNLKDWKFKYDRAVRRAGQCSYRNKTISLSKYYAEANSADEIKDTILHEIAHALAWINYKHAGHGPEWKKVAREIGAKPERCYDAKQVVMPKGRLKASCSCGKPHYRHRQLRKGYSAYCVGCNDRLTYKLVKEISNDKE